MARPTDSDTSLRYIVRMPDRLWRVCVEVSGELIGRQYFSDKQYGGKQASLAVATQWRNALLKKHKIARRVYDGNGYCLTNTRNKTGSVGVSLSIETRGGYQSAYWSATYQKDGRQMRVRKSIRKYGYQAAWNMAQRIRRKKTEQALAEAPPPTQELLEWAAKYEVDLTTVPRGRPRKKADT